MIEFCHSAPVRTISTHKFLKQGTIAKVISSTRGKLPALLVYLLELFLKTCSTHVTLLLAKCSRHLRQS